MNHCVYILFSGKLNRFYIGYTSDLGERMLFHKEAPSHKFTSKAKDWILYYKIECSSKTQVLQIENHIKKMKSKKYIENLRLYPEITTKLLIKYSGD